MEIGKVKKGEEEERKNKEGRGQNWGGEEEEEEERYKAERTITGLFPGFAKEEIFFSPKSVTDCGYDEIRPPEKNDCLTLFQISPFYQQGL